MDQCITFVQARMSSRRLPGKVLKTICGKPMIIHQLNRLRQANNIGKIVVLTSQESSDDILASTLEKYNFQVFRGSLHNVLNRFHEAFQQHPAENIIRITADCPLIDPVILEKVVETHIDGNYSYTSNTLQRTFPDGTDVEVFSREALKTTYEQASTSFEQEHVTPYISSHPELFSLHNYTQSANHENMRWTVDTLEDFEFVTKIYEKLYPENPLFTYQDILKTQDKI